MAESVKVAVRVRPFNQREKNAKSECIISMRGVETTITSPENGEKRTFAFDHSYWSHSNFVEDEKGLNVAEASGGSYADQRRVYEDLGKGVLDNAWAGYNAALFAYGQTGSGKSYSMIGYGPNKGIVPITCDELFKAIDENSDATKQFQVSFSMLEIYNEQVRDLLQTTTKNKQQPKEGLRVRQNPKTGFYVENLKEVAVKEYKQIEYLMEQGTFNRTTASTNMNATSSRSHMLITITFKQIYKNDLGQSTTKSSEINLVDLAGSERADSTGATGDRLKEGSAINQSLSTLGKVISALADQATSKKKIMVPYRDSVLTKLLQSALGGNSKTIMIAALSPAGINHDETLSTLRYADRAKRIKNKATINEDPTDKLIRELKEENQKLLTQLKKMQSGGKGDFGDISAMLEANQKKMNAMESTWEEKLEEAKKEWEKSHRVSSASSQPEDTAIRTPYIQNVNEDPQLSGVVKYPIKHGSNILGRSGKGVTIEIRGLRILDQHAYITHDDSGVYIEPCKLEAKILHNGIRVKKKHTMKHLDRLQLGSSSLYIYIGPEEERNANDNIHKYDYDFIQNEIAEASGENLMLPSATPRKREDPELDQATLLVFQEYLDLLPKIYEVNAMSEDMKKGVVFEAEIKNLASHNSLGRPKDKEVVIRVTNKHTSQVWRWPKGKFINRKFMIEDLYNRWSDGGNITIDQNRDPFWDPVEDIYLGSCHVWLNNIAYCLDSDDHMEVRNDKGKQEAMMRVRLFPCDEHGNIFKDEKIVFDPKELLDSRLDFIVNISQCTEVKWVKDERSRGIYCGFNFFEHPELIISKKVWHSQNLHLDFQKHFTVHKVTEDLLDYLQSHALVIELWGTQAGSTEDMERVMTPDGNVTLTDDTLKPNDVKTLQQKLAQQEQLLSKMRRENETLMEENVVLQQRASIQSAPSGERKPTPISTPPPSPIVNTFFVSHSPLTKSSNSMKTLTRQDSKNNNPKTFTRHDSKSNSNKPTKSFTRKDSNSNNLPPNTLPPLTNSTSSMSDLNLTPDSISLLSNPNLKTDTAKTKGSPQKRSSGQKLSTPRHSFTSQTSQISQNGTSHNVNGTTQNGKDHVVSQPPPPKNSSLDTEIAKALKVFFKDVKNVQKEVHSMTENAEELTSCGTNGNFKKATEKHISRLSHASDDLDKCVTMLKDTMVSVIRNKRVQSGQKEGV